MIAVLCEECDYGHSPLLQDCDYDHNPFIN